MFNIDILSVLKSLKDGTMKQHVSEELERMKLIEDRFCDYLDKWEVIK